MMRLAIRTHVHSRVALVLVTLGCLAYQPGTAAQAPARPRYRIVDLGTLGGNFSRARAINNRGEITGEAFVVDDEDVTAFYWQGGRMRQITPYTPGSAGDSSGNSINNDGVVVGYYDPSGFPPNPPAEAFRYDPATQRLDFLGATRAVDINDAGQILAVGPGAAYFIVGGANLPNLNATALNASGEVVGFGVAVGTGSSLYIQGQFFPIPDPAFQPSDLNDRREIVGSVLENLGLFGNRGRVRLIRYNTRTPPAMTTVDTFAPLAFLGSARASAINNLQQIVGTETTTVSGRQVKTPFIIENGVTRRLSDFLPPNSGWVLSGDFAEANDINDRGEIVGTGLINGEWHAFLMTPLVCSGAEDWDGDGEGDDDGDGLCDSWETRGVDGDGDGAIDLMLSTNPERKDLFVEIDYMVSFADPHNHRPRDQALAKVTRAFDNAPVANPDSSTGVTLHLDLDDFISEIEPLIFSANGPGASDDFNDVKRGNASYPCGAGATGFFGTAANRADPNCEAILKAREMVYRYAIFGHNFIRDISSMNDIGVSGIAEIGGNDFMVTLGGWSEDGIRNSGASADLNAAMIEVEAGTFMHEFGHTLGLFHGGGDGINCKPNYLSVMNYSFQDLASVPNRPLDYSSMQLPTLDENHLDETVGIRGPANRFTVYGAPPDAAPALGDSNGPIDWDLDGQENSGLSLDISTILDGDCGPRATTFLTGFDDWSSLHYSFLHSPDFADGTRRGTVGNDPERTEEQSRAAARSIDFDRDGTNNFPDNCPAVANPGQEDADGDGVGNACDESGNPEDVTPPVLALPTDVVAEATGASGAAVNFAVSATDDVDGVVPVTCTPESGATFAIGTTEVTCTASDAGGNSAMGSFTVAVTDLPTPGKMVGSGRIDGADASTYRFSFEIRELDSGTDSGLFWVEGPDGVFAAEAIVFARFSDDSAAVAGPEQPPLPDTAIIAGPGSWKGERGYSFRIVATDRGEPGAGRDTVEIVVRSADGAVVAAVSGLIRSGNLQAKPWR